MKASLPIKAGWFMKNSFSLKVNLPVLNWEEILKTCRDVRDFLILALSLPLIVGHLLGETVYTNLLQRLYYMFVLAFFLFIPLYQQLLVVKERRKWKFMLGLTWAYLAVVGVYLLVLFVC